jgi:hypothetical protein
MQKRNNYFIVFTVVTVLFLAAIFSADLLYKFGNYDTPFILAFVSYILYLIVTKSTSRKTFIIVLFLIICMGCCYMLTGPSRLTERIGQWFYHFFVLGMIQYVREVL